MVSWESRGAQDGSGSGMRQQRYDASGTAVGGEVRVNTYTTGDQTYSTVSALSDGGWVVAWQSAGQDGSGLGVYPQIFKCDSTKRGTEHLVTQTTAGDQYQPAVTGLASGNFVVTWGSTVTSATYSLYGRQFQADGTALGADSGSATALPTVRFSTEQGLSQNFRPFRTAPARRG